jgi:hypothetical protein
MPRTVVFEVNIKKDLILRKFSHGTASEYTFGSFN